MENEVGESMKSKASAPSTIRRKKEHIHPCICDNVKSRKRISLTPEELKQKSVAYLRPVSKKELLERGTLQEPEGEKTSEEEAEEAKKKLEEEKKKKHDEMKKANICLQKQQVEGTPYELHFIKKNEDIYSKRKGNIKWKKDPEIQIKQTKTSKLRKEHRNYCKPKLPRYAYASPNAGDPAAAPRALPPPPKG